MDSMTIATLSTSILVALIPYFKAGTEAFAKSAGEEAASKVGEVFRLIKKRFGDNPKAEQVLANLEKFPEDGDFQNLFKDVLERILHEDPRFAENLNSKITNKVFQRIVAQASTIEDVEMTSRGKVNTRQEIEADNSSIKGIKMSSSE